MPREVSTVTRDDQRPYLTTTVLSSSSDIAQLNHAFDAIRPDPDVTLTPSFFLASLAENWLPRVVLVRRDDQTAGIVYGKERTIAGFRTGMIYADGRLGTLAVAQPLDRQDVALAAIHAWFALPRVRGVRLAISPTCSEARALTTQRSRLSVDLSQSGAPSTELHSRLTLPADYETFLASLGKKTRRNFRYYRRRFEAAGHRYVERLSYDDFDRAAIDLRTKCHLSSSIGEIQRAVRTVKSAGEPWLVGLQHSNGDWLSIAAGWCAPGCATMFLQLNNDREFADASLSVVLRAFLIEMLIRDGVSELVFWSGSAPPLSRYVKPIPAIAVHLDRATPAWRFIRGVISTTEPLIGRWITADVRWMVGTERPPDAFDSDPEPSGPPEFAYAADARRAPDR